MLINNMLSYLGENNVEELKLGEFIWKRSPPETRSLMRFYPIVSVCSAYLSIFPERFYLYILASELFLPDLSLAQYKRMGNSDRVALNHPCLQPQDADACWVQSVMDICAAAGYCEMTENTIRGIEEKTD